MPHRVKCPDCNSCLAPQWIMPNRYYYCDFCRVYYGGRDGELYIVPTETIHKMIKDNQDAQQSNGKPA